MDVRPKQGVLNGGLAHKRRGAEANFGLVVVNVPFLIECDGRRRVRDVSDGEVLDSD